MFGKTCSEKHFLKTIFGKPRWFCQPLMTQTAKPIAEKSASYEGFKYYTTSVAGYGPIVDRATLERCVMVAWVGDYVPSKQICTPDKFVQTSDKETWSMDVFFWDPP